MSSSSSNAKPVGKFSLLNLNWPRSNPENRTRGKRSSIFRPPPPPPPPSRNNEKAGGIECPNKEGGPAAVSLSSPACEEMERSVPVEAMAVEKMVEKAKTAITLRIKPNVCKGQNSEKEEDEATAKRPWNLRPERPKHYKKSNADSTTKDKGKEKVDAPKKVKPKKPSFSISLTKQEIEEDFIGMTGLKLPRKPKKRSKSLQKELDTLFPGVRLASANSDPYASLPKGI